MSRRKVLEIVYSIYAYIYVQIVFKYLHVQNMDKNADWMNCIYSINVDFSREMEMVSKMLIFSTAQQ